MSFPRTGLDTYLCRVDVFQPDAFQPLAGARCAGEPCAGICAGEKEKVRHSKYF